MQRAPGLALLAFAAAALAPTAGLAATCSPTATRLCLHDSRFGVEVAWTIPGGGSGVGHASPLTNDTGLFWFFKDSNLELVVKVIDGRAVNGHFWVYYGGLSDVEYTITVTDHQTDESEIYHNPASQLASGADTSAFSAEPLAASGQIRFGMLGGASATAAAAAAAVPLRQGSELQANVTTAGMQRDPDVAVGADGGAMVVWSGPPSPPETGNEMDVYGRFFDAQGNPRGGELRLNENRAGSQTRPRVAAAPGGGYMAVWQDGGLITARAYRADGQPLTGEIKVSSARGTQSFPAIGTADGGYVVAWEAPAGFDEISAIFGQRFNAQGGRAGAGFRISGPTDGQLSEPRLAAWPGGGFVATWLEGFFPGEGVVVQAQRFDTGSSPLGATIQVNVTGIVLFPGNHQEATPVVHSDGSFSIVWTTTSLPSNPTNIEGLFTRRFSVTGAALSGVIELRRGRFPQAPATALLPSGDALVLWTEEGRPADPDGGILARLFDSSWTPRGPEFRVNTFTLLPQTEPAVASDASGRLHAVWSSGLDVSQGTPPFPGWVDDSQDGSGFGVFAQRFTTATCAQTPDQLCLDGRFRVGVQFTSPWSGDPEAGHALPLTSDTGAFWFFSEDNLELTIKVLDGRPINGHFWVYAGALSDVAYTITITDTETGKVKTYHNAQGHLTSRADVEAF